MKFLLKLFIVFEYACHRVDHYLEYNQGNMMLAADSQTRADACKSRLHRMQFN